MYIKFELKTFNFFENMVKRTLEAVGRKIKEPSEFTSTIKKKTIESFFELVGKWKLNSLFFWGISLSRKGINLRHRATCKKIILGSLESILRFQRMKWSW
jgi:hypothetical protein